MKIILASPRGFCAGVRRAIEIVENAIIKFGTPLYVKHEIVHNKYVVESFQKRGVIFTDDISQVPTSSTIVFSAHGVSDAVIEQSHAQNLQIIDATCPLVTKVHREVTEYDTQGMEIILIGHKGHPEMEGTSGKIKGKYTIVETVQDVENLQVENPSNLALATQTTLSIDDTKAIVDALLLRFPDINKHYKSDICYATQNRQNIVKDMVNEITKLVVVGSKESSNSNRLRDIGTENNIPSFLVDRASNLDISLFNNEDIIGITAGASAPENLVWEIIDFFKTHFNATIENAKTSFEEDVVFHLPKIVRI
ncbi:MAG: 4-hydroxy-3-methylbut-2-enyl diphosphate reductase [Proteobacteria bacterium]|jgi:4-hydroxy-3-methylbut-2-en-1-yl diphosphate reductase|nr:4-hydroxy-3-methylbut-2-enyl diphosphate reductase [Pseudomonadota bacterium]